MLKELSDARVFDVDIAEDKKIIRFQEGCDDYFSYMASKRNLGELIQELKQIYDEMEEL